MINLEDDKFSIGDFSINYIDINEIKLEKNILIVLNCQEGKNYKILIDSKTGRMIATKKVLSSLQEKLKLANIKNAKEFLQKLPQLYKEISINDLVSRLKLEQTELIDIIEHEILEGRLEAEINNNILRLKKGLEQKIPHTDYVSKPSKIEGLEKKEGILLFVSYATKDADLYKISELAHNLETYKDIREVLYWQEDMHDSIIEYMNDNLGRCDVVLLFCSPNALESVPVKKEWMAAESLKKPIIPIFIKPEHIPPLLSDRLGIEFDTFNLQKSVQDIYELTLKKQQT